VRGKGEGSVFKDRATGLWTAIIELPPRNGKRRRKVVRRKTKAALLDAMADVASELKKRGDLPTKGQTVEQWFTYWLREIAAKDVRPKTLDGYRASVAHIVKAIGKVKLEKVTAAHVRRVHDHITETLGFSSTTALLAHRVMAVSFKAAMREGRIGRNPTELLNAPRKAVAPQEAFDVDEAMRVLEHVSHDPVMGARWATALLTGARRGEVIGIERDRVTDQLDLSWQLQRLTLTETTGVPNVPADFEYRHLLGGLYLTRPKSNAGWRVIPLVDPLRGILERHMASTPDNQWGLLFTSNGRPIDPDQDSARWKDVLTATGIEKNVVLHGLRHTAVDLLYLAGVPEDLIMEIAGHSSRSVSQSYKTRGKVNRARLDDAMERFSALFTRPDGGRLGKPGAIED
jgi:Site-specific recombinase XerD